MCGATLLLVTLDHVVSWHHYGLCSSPDTTTSFTRVNTFWIANVYFHSVRVRVTMRRFHDPKCVCSMRGECSRHLFGKTGGHAYAFLRFSKTITSSGEPFLAVTECTLDNWVMTLQFIRHAGSKLKTFDFCNVNPSTRLYIFFLFKNVHCFNNYCVVNFLTFLQRYLFQFWFNTFLYWESPVAVTFFFCINP